MEPRILHPHPFIHVRGDGRRQGQVNTCAVTDLGRARQFYCDALGFDEYAGDGSCAWLRAPEEFDVCLFLGDLVDYGVEPGP